MTGNIKIIEMIGITIEIKEIITIRNIVKTEIKEIIINIIITEIEKITKS